MSKHSGIPFLLGGVGSVENYSDAIYKLPDIYYHLWPTFGLKNRILCYSSSDGAIETESALYASF